MMRYKIVCYEMGYRHFKRCGDLMDLYKSIRKLDKRYRGCDGYFIDVFRYVGNELEYVYVKDGVILEY